ncbi:MAG: biopolymer transporter ExbD [Planctomycetota bacterium]
MPRTRTQRANPEPPNLTPVVNVAMVVLVVFMLTASFIEPQPYMQSKVALLEQGGQSEYTAADEPLRVLVDVAPSSPSQYRATIGGDTGTNGEELLTIFQQRAQALGGTEEALAETQVEISPQSAVIWQHLITVYEAAQRAGFSSITFTPGR